LAATIKCLVSHRPHGNWEERSSLVSTVVSVAMRPLPHRARVEQRSSHGCVATIERIRDEDLHLAEDEGWIAIREF